MLGRTLVEQPAGQRGDAQLVIRLQKIDPAQRRMGDEDRQAMIFQEQQRQAIRQLDALRLFEGERLAARVRLGSI